MSTPGTILIVDDEPALRFALGELLGERGHRVITAASGHEALTSLDDADVVLSDLNMPGMDGLALLAEIAARDPSLPVLLLTAHGSERVAVQALKAGAYDYLTKPVDLRQFRTVVASALGRPVVGAAEAPPVGVVGHALSPQQRLDDKTPLLFLPRQFRPVVRPRKGGLVAAVEVVDDHPHPGLAHGILGTVMQCPGV